jgi:tetratricopeptide (TPR) repeat protein
MSRFKKLELNPGQSNEVSQELRGKGVGGRDASHCLTEADSAFSQAEFLKALRWYARVLEYDPYQEAAWAGQVRSLIELGKFGEANVWADKGLERFPESSDLLSGKAMALGRSGHSEDALPFSDIAIEHGSNNPYAWLARGDVLLATQNKQVQLQVHACFDRAQQAAPGDWWVRWMTGRVQKFWNQYAPALKSARDAAALVPERFVVWLLCAECQAALGLREAATQSYHQVLALHPHCEAAEVGLEALRQTSWIGNQIVRIRNWFRN